MITQVKGDKSIPILRSIRLAINRHGFFRAYYYPFLVNLFRYNFVYAYESDYAYQPRVIPLIIMVCHVVLICKCQNFVGSETL